MTAPLILDAVGKTFTLHLLDGTSLPVLRDVSFSVPAGECVVLAGPSGIGKSTILRMIYGNYRASAGRILVANDDGPIDVAAAHPREIIELRRFVLGYVSQFLRVVPRVPALQVVAEPLLAVGWSQEDAEERASELLTRLNVPKKLWPLPPATFSGGERQRVNIARGFAIDHPILLLDEPTASLDRANRDAVVNLIEEAKAKGAACLGIFHDSDVVKAVGDRIVDVRAFAA